MRKLADLMTIFRRRYLDVTGLDAGASGTKVVRLSRANGRVRLVAADILPGLSLGDAVTPLALPKTLRGRYVALAAAAPGAVVKLLTVPAQSDKPMDTQVGELTGTNGAGGIGFRVSYETLQETRSEVRVLAVTFPDPTARSLCALFPEGTPAPCSIEYSGLASLTAFQNAVGIPKQEGCLALIESGATVTMLSFFCKGALVMTRKFDFGINLVLKKIQDSLGVNPEVAAGILADESFDLSKIVHQVMEPFLQQIIVSFDFVERRENVRVEKLYGGGGGMLVRPWVHEIESATGHKATAWNPFEGIVVSPDAFSGPLKGQESRFSAAMGAALGMLETV